MPAKNRRPKRPNPRHGELGESLAPVVRERDLGLITQAEYEARLEQLRATLDPDEILVEFDLPGGITRFALRSTRTGATLARFHFPAEP